MTDNEIIKALECCNGWNGRCLNCPLNREGTNCKEKLNSYTLDLINRLKMKNKELDERNVIYRGTVEWQAKEINRQKAEIERLNVELQSMRNAANSYKMELERLKSEIEETNEADREAEVQALKENKENAKLFCEAINHATSKAIKEFAEELEYFVLNEDIEVVEPKCKDYESYINGANQFRHQIKNGINNLVKERTEVETNQRKEDEEE